MPGRTNHCDVLKIYYKIWVECIIRVQSVKANKDNWQMKAMYIMTVSMVFNLLLIMLPLQRDVFGRFFYDFKIHGLSGFENYILTMILLYILPCVILNYLLIFRSRRYEKLIKKYPYRNGKLFFRYFLISMGTPVLILVLMLITNALNIKVPL